MNWQDQGIITRTQKFSETSLIVNIFSQEKGLISAMVKGGRSKAKFPIYQISNLVEFKANARLEEHMPKIHAEIKKNYLADFLNNQQITLCCKSILEMINQTMPQGQAHQDFFAMLIDFMNQLKEAENIIAKLILLEVEILTQIGFGLDLTKCAVTQETENLYYISPNSARAVTKKIGAKYHDKLFIIPDFFHKPEILKTQIISKDSLKNALQITQFFLEKFFYKPHKQKLPISRNLLENIL
jgi:DNA repair protein RecO (recombination protein O)